MKKKLTVFLLALVLSLSCFTVACGDGKEKAGNVVETPVLAAAASDIVTVVGGSGEATVGYEQINSDFHTLTYNGAGGKTYDFTNTKPLVLKTVENAATFEFSTRLRVDKMSKDVPFIEFLPIPTDGIYNPDTELNAISTAPIVDFKTVTVTLTQVSDPTKTLTYQVTARGDINYESCTYIGGDGQKVQSPLLGSGGRPGQWQSGFGLQTTIPFNGLFASTKYAAGLYFEPTENTGYVFPNRNKKQYIIRDLDSDIWLNQDPVWLGFTDNEVKLSIKLDSITSDVPAQLAILSINGAKLGENVADTDAPEVNVAKSFTDNIEGQVGKSFPIPAFEAYDAQDGIVENISSKVWFAYNSASPVAIPVTDGKFTPTKSGVYTIETSATDAAGNVGKLFKNVTVREKLVPLTAVLDKVLIGGAAYEGDGFPIEVKMGQKITCPTAEVSGGTDGKGYDIEVTDPNGNPVALDVTRSFVIQKQGVYRVRYALYDYLNNRVNFDYFMRSTISIQPVVEFPVLPEVVAQNYVVSIPKFVATDWYSYISPVDANVTAYLKAPGATDFVKLDGMKYSCANVGSAQLKLEAKAVKAGTGATPVEKIYDFEVVEGGKVKNYFTSDNLEIKNVNEILTFVPSTPNEYGTFDFINPLYAESLSVSLVNTSLESAEGAADGWQAIEKVKLQLRDRDDAGKTVTIMLSAFSKSNEDRFKGIIEFNGNEYIVASSFDPTKPFDIDMRGGKTVVSSGVPLGKITHFDNGEEFDKFPSGFAYLSVSVLANRYDAHLELTDLCGHSNFLYEGYDISNPIVVATEEMRTSAKVGEVIKVPAYTMYDIFCGDVDAMTTITNSNGDVIAKRNGAIEFTALVHGQYNVEVYGVDQFDNALSYNVAIHCNNLTKPTIMMMASVPTTGKVGSTITLTKATAKDSLGEEIECHIFVARPGGSAVLTKESQDGKTISFTPDRAGKYTVYYHAYDDNFNAQWIKYFIQVA